VPPWLILKSFPIAPGGPGVDSAYLVRLTRNNELRELVIEFAAPSSLTSVGYAEEVARRFLREDEPPGHLVIGANGEVELATSDDA
jgi:hypothetical protein